MKLIRRSMELMPSVRDGRAAIRVSLVVALRVVAVGWALAVVLALWAILPMGWLVGLQTWAADGAAAGYLLIHLALALAAAVLVGRRPQRGTAALAGIALWSAGAVALALARLAPLAHSRLSWEHDAVGYLQSALAGLLSAALVLPLLGLVLVRIRPRSELHG